MLDVLYHTFTDFNIKILLTSCKNCLLLSISLSFPDTEKTTLSSPLAVRLGHITSFGQCTLRRGDKR